MNNPTMFDKPVKKYNSYPVYIIAHASSGKKFKSELIPNHYTNKLSAEFMLNTLDMQDNYSVVELNYDPNEGVYERS